MRILLLACKHVLLHQKLLQLSQGVIDASLLHLKLIKRKKIIWIIIKVASTATKNNALFLYDSSESKYKKGIFQERKTKKCCHIHGYLAQKH